MIIERIPADYSYRAGARKLQPEQIAQRSTWARVPDQETTLAAMHAIHVVPMGASTVTHLNPLDPATVADIEAEPEAGPGWLVRPGDEGPVFRVRSIR